MLYNLKNGPTPASFCLFSFFSNTIFTERKCGRQRVSNSDCRIEGKYADHLTTTTARNKVDSLPQCSNPKKSHFAKLILSVKTCIALPAYKQFQLKSKPQVKVFKDKFASFFQHVWRTIVIAAHGHLLPFTDGAASEQSP